MHTLPGSPTQHNRTLGQIGERLAEAHLVSLGFTTISRNWRCPHGELDLIMRDGDAAVAVEVKTRGSTVHGSPFHAITPRKAERLRRLLFEWARNTRGSHSRLRLDAVAVTLSPTSPRVRIEHLRGIS